MDRISLPPHSRSLFERLMDEPLSSAAELREALQGATRSFSEEVAGNDYVDSANVAALVESCLGLIALFDDGRAEEQRRMIQAAVHYFVLEDDGDDDRGIGGLDDDIQVINSVASALDQPGLIIAL